MSEQHSTPATEIEQRAALWVQQKHFWVWTAENQTALDGWLAQSPAHRVAYIRLDAALRRSNRLAALNAPRKTFVPEPRFRPFVSKMVAAFALVALIGGAITYLDPGPKVSTYSTQIGGRQTIALADGTHIEMNTNTRLRVALSKTERKVWLEKGEAYFQVAHNAKRPFTVFAGDSRVVDLGTKFLLRHEPGRLEVDLLEGQVEIAKQKDPSARTTVLNPGDTAIVTAAAVSVKHKTPREIVEKLGWRRGVVTFDRTTLADAVAEFNRYNRHQLIITDPATARITIGGTFDVSNVETFIDIARQDFGLHTESRPDATVISK